MSSPTQSDRPSSDSQPRNDFQQDIQVMAIQAVLASEELQEGSTTKDVRAGSYSIVTAEPDIATSAHMTGQVQASQLQPGQHVGYDSEGNPVILQFQVEDPQTFPLSPPSGDHTLSFNQPTIDQHDRTTEVREEVSESSKTDLQKEGNEEEDTAENEEEGNREDVEDTHRCGKCNLVFTNLEDYIHHKVYGDKCKVKYGKTFLDKQALMPQILRGRGRGRPVRGRGRPRKVDKPTQLSENEQVKKAPAVRFKRSLQLHTPDNIYTNTSYKCPKCEKTFRREAALNRHVEYDHVKKEDVEVDEEDEEDKDSEGREDFNEEQNVDWTSGGSLKPYGCTHCGKYFREATILRAHYLTHSDRREFQCNWQGCTFSFKTKGSLKRHRRRHTGERPYKCEQCQRCFGESGALSRHLKSRTPCTAKTDSDFPRYGKRQELVLPPSMLTDMSVGEDQSQHSADHEPTTECLAVTEEVMQTSEVVNIAGQENTEKGPVIVQIDDTTLEGLEGDEVHHCRACQVVLANEHLLKIHLRSHLALTPFRCGLCAYATAKKDQLDLHKRVAHHMNLPMGPAAGTNSEQLLMTTGVLPEGTEGKQSEVHPIKAVTENGDVNMDLSVQESDGVVTGAEVTIMATPLQAKETTPIHIDGNTQPESADSANQTRDASIALEQLLELKDTSEGEVNVVMTSGIHGYKPLHKCRVCGRSFRGLRYLGLHMRIHTGERPHKCTLCPKTFGTKDTLAKHIQAHSTERHYQCGECGKLFKRISHVKEHLKIHSSERPYPCHYCEKSFKTTNACKVHLRTHTDIFPWQCRYCHRTFREKGSLDRHLRVHTGSKPYKCRHCLRCFAEHGTLNRHLKAKIPCTKQLQVLREKGPRSAPSGGAADVSAGGDDGAPTGGEEDQTPTVLAEFSSMVAHTQQYIIQTDDSQDNVLTPSYVMLTADGQPQAIEILTEAMSGDPNVLPGTEYVLLDQSDIHMVTEDGQPLELGPDDVSIEGPIAVVQAGGGDSGEQLLQQQEQMEQEVTEEEQLEAITLVAEAGDTVQQALVEARVVEVAEEGVQMVEGEVQMVEGGVQMVEGGEDIVEQVHIIQQAQMVEQVQVVEQVENS